jgi:threonine synthase
MKSCPSCSRPLLARYDLEVARATLLREDMNGRGDTMWRYREVLPVKQEDNRLCLGEGWTPLVHARRLGADLGLSHLLIKNESLNPTGSFKARGLCMAVSRARELGARELTIASAGNAAGAMAAYAALANLRAHVYLPADASDPFVAECRALGAEVTLVEGNIANCATRSSLKVRENGWFDLSTLREPYRVEGKKTMGYELAEQLRWRLPDVIVYPTGGGSGLLGIWKAFDELEEMGFIGSERPRMVAVQSEGCAPIVKSFLTGKKHAEYWEGAETIASGLRVPDVSGDFLILDVLRRSRGTAVAVSDEEILRVTTSICRTEGIYACPEGGAALCGLLRLRERGWLDGDETVVVFNTGSGHKYTHLWLEE